MRWKKVKMVGVLLFFAAVVAAGFFLPGLALRWQDQKMKNQIKYETVEEVVLQSGDLFPLEEKLKLFSGYDSNAQVALISSADTESWELEETMDQAAYTEYETLKDLGILPWDWPEEEVGRIGYLNREKYFVFDKNNPSKSMVVWTYLFQAAPDREMLVVLNVEQDSKKALGFMQQDMELRIDKTRYNSYISEDAIRDFGQYLEMDIAGMERRDFSTGERQYTSYENKNGVVQEIINTKSELEAHETEYEAVYPESMGEPWQQREYRVLMQPQEEDSDESAINYRIAVSGYGCIFGEEISIIY